MKSIEERRDEQRKFENDVFYEVWRSGGNPDRINYDRLNDCYYDQHDAETCASRMLREQRQSRERQREQIEEQEYPYEAQP